MSYDTWKLRSDLDDSCEQFAQDEYEDLEATAAMLGVTVDEYLANKALDRYVARHQEPPEDNQIPF